MDLMDILKIISQLIQGNVGAADPRAPQAPTEPQWAQGGAPGEDSSFITPAGDLRSRMTADQANAYQRHRMGERDFAGMTINPWMPQDAFNQAYANKKFPWTK